MATIQTVLGDEVELYVETDEPLPSAVQVTYTAKNAREGTTTVTPPPVFTDNLTAVPSALRPPPNTAAFASRIKWVVNLNKANRDALMTVTLTGTVRGKFASGRN